MASAQVVETSVNTNNSPSRDYTTNPDDHLNHNILLLIVPSLVPSQLLGSFGRHGRRRGYHRIEEDAWRRGTEVIQCTYQIELRLL